MSALETPASAGSTPAHRLLLATRPDHPRVGGEQASTITGPRLGCESLCHESPEGVITA